ncbi:MAG: hypothetical protein Q4B28_01740 [bacterium]|nr:hypothetical protein [bacterium]
MIKLLRSQGKEELLEDIDEMLSAIDNGDDVSNFDIPERIKRESRVTERLLNFYVTLIGGFTSAKGDSFYLRLHKPELLEFFSQETLTAMLGSELQLDYAGNMLYQYSKNLYYYRFIDDKVRAGKNRFSIPVKGDTRPTISNFAVIKLYTEGMICSFFQDLNPKETKLRIKNTQLLADFRKQFGAMISTWVKKENPEFIQLFYAPLLEQLGEESAARNFLQTILQEEDVINLKDALYKLEYWLAYYIFLQFQSCKIAKHYGTAFTLALHGAVRETILGMGIVMTYLHENVKNLTEDQRDCLWILYIRDILGIKHSKANQLLEGFKRVWSDFHPFLKVWIGFDDNPDFLKLIAKNIQKIMENKTYTEVLQDFTGEDMIRFRGLLKNISYYNKRYVIPS